MAAPATLPPVDAFSKAWNSISGVPKTALAELRTFAEKYPELADLAKFGQAKVLLRTDIPASLRLYDSLAGLAGNPLAVLAREDLAEMRFLGDRIAADTTEVEALRDVLGRELRRPLQIRLQKRLLADLVAGRKYASAESLFFVRLVGGAPLKDIREGLTLFKADPARLASDVMRSSLAKAMLALDRADTALELLDSVSARRPLTAQEWGLKGRILLDLGRAPDAIAALRRAAEEPREELAFLWLAKGLERVGRAADAQEALLEYARRWPASAKAQEILWGRAVDAERLGNCSEASGWFGRVKDGGGKRAEWARFREGYCWFRMGDFSKSEKIWGRERLKASGTYRDAAWYFQARALQLMGSDSLARREYAALARTAPWGFHGHLARRRLGVDSAFGDSLRRVADTGAMVWPGIQPVALLKADSVALLHFLCAQEIGDDWLVRGFGKQLDQGVVSSGARELALVLWMKALGIEGDATPRARKLLGRLSGEELAKLPKPILRFFYPMPYLAVTKPLLANDSLLNSAFVHAVMRQESGYDRFAKSGAGAMGLLQLMPPTARAMAKKAGLGGFRTEQLTDPAINIRLGVTYMRDLVRVWKGQLPLVLANYNAGPAPTMRWLDGFLNLPIEQAAEEITYWETRDYVKKCMANYWTYQLLYSDSR